MIASLLAVALTIAALLRFANNPPESKVMRILVPAVALIALFLLIINPPAWTAPPAISQSVPATTLVFDHGLDIALDGHPVAVTGFDNCSGSGNPGAVWHSGTLYSFERNDDCIVVTPKSHEIGVNLHLKSGDVLERWQVLRDTGTTELGLPYARTSFRRPDGSPVVEWGAYMKHMETLSHVKAVRP